MNEKKVALVTGGNKGIGLAIVRGLAKEGFRVILGARDAAKGEEVAKQLQSEDLDVIAHQLDVTDTESITHAAAFVAEQGGVDLLVNNAGTLQDYENSILNPDLKKIKRTIDTNTFGPLLLTNAILPSLKKGARVINVSSGMGALSDMTGSQCPGYRLSKTALNAVTKMFAVALADQEITVNSLCPGWVKTDMGGDEAPRTVEQGADTAIWLATVEPSPTGKFFRDRKEIGW